MEIEKFYNTADIKRFYFPGKIFSGKGALALAAEVCDEVVGQIVIVIDEAVSKRQDIQDVVRSLKHKTIALRIIGGAPITQHIEEFTSQFSKMPDAILSIGGGSVTDFAKGIIALYLYGTISDIGISGGPSKISNDKPILVSVPTTAGSGAEASRYYVTYDIEDHHKVYGKTFNLIADWIFIEPNFLESIPRDILVSCAFDAFIHFFESFICRYERSRFGEMLSLNGISEVMGALDKAIYQNIRDDRVHASLMESATLAGVAITNVRTGSIHEGAGALLELTNLSHSETLFVFFRDAIEQYSEAISDRESLLAAHLRVNAKFKEIQTMDDIISWWEKLFVDVGLDAKVRKELGACQFPLEKVRTHVFQRIFTDKVWVGKESPVLLDENLVWNLIDLSFARFGLKCIPS